MMQSLSHDGDLMRYFDLHRVRAGKYPERAFFWGILYTVRKKLVQQLIADVFDKRVHGSQTNRQAVPEVKFN